MKRTLFFLIFLLSIIGNVKAQDSKTCSGVKSMLIQLGVDCTSVEIADGRSNGGTRSIIIAIKTSYSKKERIDELIRTLMIGPKANKKYGADLDEIAVVVGSKSNRSLAAITTRIYNVSVYFDSNKNNDDTLKFIRTWTALRFDAAYLSSLLQFAKQA